MTLRVHLIHETSRHGGSYASVTCCLPNPEATLESARKRVEEYSPHPGWLVMGFTWMGRFHLTKEGEIA